MRKWQSLDDFKQSVLMVNFFYLTQPFINLTKIILYFILTIWFVFMIFCYIGSIMCDFRL